MTIKQTKSNPKYANKNEYFNRGTYLWGIGMNWKDHDEFFTDGKKLTKANWADIENGWETIDEDFIKDMGI